MVQVHLGPLYTSKIDLMKKIVDDNFAGSRLDVFLSEELGKTRSQIKRLVEAGLVLLNNKKPKKAGDKLKSGDEIEILEIEEEIKSDTKIPHIKVLAEEKNYLVIEKPTDLLVHPTEAEEKNTLKDWLIETFPEINGVGEHKDRPGIVHRLDKDVSGVMVVAKNQTMFENLKEQFKSRSIDKIYTVLVHGVVEKDHGLIDFAIERGTDGRMAARPHVDTTKLKNVGKEQTGKEALTEFWVEKRFSRFTLLKIKIHTGRTHQIRVHMLAYGHPIVGDKLYLNKKLNLKRDIDLGRIFLHSTQLSFADINNEEVTFESKLPSKLQKFLTELN